jgi:hypothetical protein
LVELCEEPKPRHHFIGSIVTMPSKSVPEGVSKFVLIDGQQRLTTLLVLLAAVRDKSLRRVAAGLTENWLFDRLSNDQGVSGWGAGPDAILSTASALSATGGFAQT